MRPMFGAMTAEAWRAMGVNRLRTALTMLGVIIGVGAVVLMLAVGQGAQFMVNQSIASMGSNMFVVLSGSTTSGGRRFGAGTTPTLTLADANAIAELPAVAAVAPVAHGSAQFVYGALNWSTVVNGTTPGYLKVRDWGMASGQPFTDADVRAATRVVLLGKTVAENLFGDEDPTGKTVRIKDSPYHVLGLLASKGQTLDGRDQDDTALIPVTTAQRKLFGSHFPGTVRFVMVQARSEQLMPQAEAEMNALLRQRHHIGRNQEEDFTIRNLTAVAEAAASVANVLSLMLGAIASISLVVGGIGIMNIMLVSVSERTREIGIRMAVGARPFDIMLQFLLEASIISALGGIAGALVGFLGAVVVSALAKITVVVTTFSIVLSFLVAAGIGVFFGFYPARKAAHLKPIEALRHE
jgi:putative ABC transport system permease protein